MKSRALRPVLAFELNVQRALLSSVSMADSVQLPIGMKKKERFCVFG
jgi:hypothetical protein